MRKIVVVTAVFLLLVGVMLSGQAIAQKATPITKQNMSVLKGTWQGRADWDVPGASPSTFIMTITNDAPPFKGTIEFRELPSPTQLTFPGNMQGASSYGPGNFENGQITPKGNFIITGEGGNFGEFSLVGKDLNGWFYLWGAKGTFTLKKK